MSAVRDARVTLGVSIALIVAVGALTLAHSPPRVVRVGVTTDTETELARLTGATDVCQAGETLPAGVSAIRVALIAFYGASVRVRVLSGAQVLTEGRRGPNWTGRSVTVPVRPLSHAFSPVRLCIEVGPGSELIDYAGVPTPGPASATVSTEASPGARGLGGRVGVEYLASSRGSWWSRILTVARHVGLGRAISGTWIVLLIAALVAAVGLLAARLALRELP
jgi:hypothetical protein